MSTTTIRLPDALKARIATAAQRTGTTAHNFILEALAEKADLAEQHTDFHDTAEQRYAGIVATGKTISWETMCGYLKDRVAGKKRTRPKAKKLAR